MYCLAMLIFESDQALCQILSNILYNLSVPVLCKILLLEDKAAEIDARDNISAMYISLPRLYFTCYLYFCNLRSILCSWTLIEVIS